MRSLSSSVISELEAKLVRPFLLMQGQFASGLLNIWTGLGNLSWNSVTWSGVGSLVSISTVGETTDIQATGIRISLTGIAADVLTIALQECHQGYPVSIWLGFMNSDGTVIADPALAFSGRMDTVEIDERADTSTITVSVESRMIDLQRARTSNYTDEEQQRLFPGDKGFACVPSVQQWNGAWGKKP